MTFDIRREFEMNISVFGGSQPREGESAYTEAMELGRLLAQHGHTVLTGGYIGTMEAVSRGAAGERSRSAGSSTRDASPSRSRQNAMWRSAVTAELALMARPPSDGRDTSRRTAHAVCDRNILREEHSAS